MSRLSDGDRLQARALRVPRATREKRGTGASARVTWAGPNSVDMRRGLNVVLGSLDFFVILLSGYLAFCLHFLLSLLVPSKQCASSSQESVSPLNVVSRVSGF